MLTYTIQFSSVFLEIGAEDLSPRWRWGTMIETASGIGRVYNGRADKGEAFSESGGNIHSKSLRGGRRLKVRGEDLNYPEPP